jgi:hypothetical protein
MIISQKDARLMAMAGNLLHFLKFLCRETTEYSEGWHICLSNSEYTRLKQLIAKAEGTE